MAAHPSAKPAQQPGQRVRIRLCIVKTCDQAVLERHSPARLFKVVLTCFHKLRQRIAVRNRNQLPALFLNRRMQGNCKRERKTVFRQPSDLRHKSAGGYGQVSLTKMKTVLMREQFSKPHKTVKIIKRLPDSHHNDTGHPLPGLLSDLIDLIKHLRRCQAARQPFLCRGAEPASHPAACLRRDTDCVAMPVAHQNTLNPVSVRKHKQIFPRPVLF